MQRNELNSYLISLTKINSKQIKRLKLEPETVELLEENMEKTSDISLRNDFMDNMKRKINK